MKPFGLQRVSAACQRGWQQIGTRYLPFADAATPELPLPRLLRLALFQVSVGMVLVLLNGTLNRVMIIELGVPAWLVALMVSLPLVFAPLRALIGFRSDTHRSVLGWRRVPYLWFGTLLQFGGLAIMPFALIILSGDTTGSVLVGHVAAGLAFLLCGAGLHTTQTAGLALATDLAPSASRPRVVALMYVMLLLGMVASSIAFGVFLHHFSQLRLIQVIQGSAVFTMIVNCIALWKQEARNPKLTNAATPRESFRSAWQKLTATARAKRFLAALGLGTAAFSMQDILLEPYGAEIMQLSVGSTTLLTALLAGGTLCAFALAGKLLLRGMEPHRLAATGALAGVVAFLLVVLSALFESLYVLAAGTLLIGMGAGLFAVSMLTVAMDLEVSIGSGLAIGAWGAVQATAAGMATAAGGILRDAVASLAAHGALGPGLGSPAVGYVFVYNIEIIFLFATLVAVGPLVRSDNSRSAASSSNTFGLAEFPG